MVWSSISCRRIGWKENDLRTLIWHHAVLQRWSINNFRQIQHQALFKLQAKYEQRFKTCSNSKHGGGLGVSRPFISTLPSKGSPTRTPSHHLTLRLLVHCIWLTTWDNKNKVHAGVVVLDGVWAFPGLVSHYGFKGDGPDPWLSTGLFW